MEKWIKYDTDVQALSRAHEEYCAKVWEFEPQSVRDGLFWGRGYYDKNTSEVWWLVTDFNLTQEEEEAVVLFDFEPEGIELWDIVLGDRQMPKYVAARNKFQMKGLALGEAFLRGQDFFKEGIYPSGWGFDNDTGVITIPDNDFIVSHIKDSIQTRVEDALANRVTPVIPVRPPRPVPPRGPGQ